MRTQMVRRPEFGKKARTFDITVGLREGYEGEQTHSIREVAKLVQSFAIECDIEFGAEIFSTTVVYSYKSDGRMVVKEEPGAKICGLFPPNKFGTKTDEELVDMIELLTAYLASPLGQTSFHANVCGVHYSFKRAGELTAHEKAQKPELPFLRRQDLEAALSRGGVQLTPVLQAALDLAERWHKDQRRIGEGPVLEQHIYPVAKLVMEKAGLTPCDRRIAIAICHDLLEDTQVPPKEVDEIDPYVPEQVEILTDTGKTPEEYFQKIQQSPEASLVKVCDRLNNLQCAHLLPSRAVVREF